MRGITLGVLSQQNQPKVLAQYTFDDFSVNPSFISAGVTASQIQPSNLDRFETINVGYESPVIIAAAESSGINQSYLTGKYFSFSLTGLSRITKIEFQVSRGGSTTGRYTGLKTSFDNFQYPLLEVEVDTARPIMTNYSLDVSLPRDSIEIRFYIRTALSTNTLEFDNIIIYGN